MLEADVVWRWRLWSIGLLTAVGLIAVSIAGASKLVAVDDPALTGLAAPRPHPMPTQLVQTCGAIAPETALEIVPERAPEIAPEVAPEAILPQSYFDAVKPSAVGYLVWSTFPVSIYVEPLVEGHEALRTRWDQAIAAVLQDWGQYLPLQRVPSADAAAIRIRPAQPPIRQNPDGTFRAQSGETRYALYAQETDDDPILMQRFDIAVKPGQADRQLEASLRHELGHALGIWGHSSSPEDALYYSQVSNPPAVSPGDIATLCEVYRQPTSLGWPLGPGAVLQ
ncbi:MAG: peptidase [Elainellaceae cyanobacterium]